jgi:hypothetical protein
MPICVVSIAELGLDEDQLTQLLDKTTWHSGVPDLDAVVPGWDR